MKEKRRTVGLIKSIIGGNAILRFVGELAKRLYNILQKKTMGRY